MHWVVVRLTIERGKRKGGDHFAPHPQILQKLALVYHVEAYD